MSMYMDDVAIFCLDPQLVSRLLSICDQFELASGAKVNRGKSEAMFFGNWADRSFIPFTVRTGYLKYANTKCHDVLRFYWSLVLRRIGLASLPRNTASSWTVPYHLFFVEKFVKRNTFDHMFIRQMHAETNITSAWRTINTEKDVLWSAQTLLVFQLKELTLTECCRLAHPKAQDHMLRDAIKLGAVGKHHH
eukprot:g32764.t1